MAPAAKKPRVETYFLKERVNVSLLEQVASSEVGAWRPDNGPYLRTIIVDLLACCSDGKLTSIWREEPLASEYGVPGRRYSGYKDGLESRVILEPLL